MIDRVWGRVKELATQADSAHALNPAVQRKGPAVQILGKERAPQVDDAASAIATQLEEGINSDVAGVSKKTSLKRSESHQFSYLLNHFSLP